MSEEFFKNIFNNEELKNKYQISEKIWGRAIKINPTLTFIEIKGESSLHYHKIHGEEYIVLNGKLGVYEGEVKENWIETIKNLKEIIPNLLRHLTQH